MRQIPAPAKPLYYGAKPEALKAALQKVREQEIQTSSSKEKGPISIPCSNKDCLSC